MHQELNDSSVINFQEARNRHYLRNKTLELDADRYQDYLDKSELSAQEKYEFLNALWTVVVAFVDLGYGIHPTQTAAGEVIDLAAEFAARNASEGVQRRASNVR